MIQEHEKISEKPQNKCPPAFTEACVLEDGTRCPYYHDGECVKAPEEADGQ